MRFKQRVHKLDVGRSSKGDEMNAIRWTLVLVVVVGAMLMASGAGAEGTPKLTGLGYPEVRIVISDDDIAVPEVVHAGRTLIVYENQARDGYQSWLVRVPDDVTAADLAAPVAEDEAPAWFFRGTF